MVDRGVAEVGGVCGSVEITTGVRGECEMCQVLHQTPPVAVVVLLTVNRRLIDRHGHGRHESRLA